MADTRKTALLYLRVSSDAQVRTDHEGDGLSLDAQRDACTRKADSLGARVVEEFVERGESGKATIRRSALAALLTRLKAGDIDYVIVHKVDRLARNRADDVARSWPRSGRRRHAGVGHREHRRDTQRHAAPRHHGARSPSSTR